MPACLTHYLFSQNVREDLKDKAELDPCAYAWGAQGPDFFLDVYKRQPMSFLRILKATSSLLPARRPSRKCRGWWWSAPSQKTRLPGKNW